MIIQAIIVAILLSSAFAHSIQAQGTIFFVTSPRLSQVNARVTYPDGTPVGPEFTAQLLAGPQGTPISSLVPVFLTARFRDSPPTDLGYVVPTDVIAENVIGGSLATVVMRAYNGADWETATFRGESIPVTVFTGDETIPPGYLRGLQGFTVLPVPEPSTFALVFVGLVALGAVARSREGRA